MFVILLLKEWKLCLCFGSEAIVLLVGVGSFFARCCFVVPASAVGGGKIFFRRLAVFWGMLSLLVLELQGSRLLVGKCFPCWIGFRYGYLLSSCLRLRSFLAPGAFFVGLVVGTVCFAPVEVGCRVGLTCVK